MEQLAAARITRCLAWDTIRITGISVPSSRFDMTLTNCRAETLPRASSLSPCAPTTQTVVTIAVVDDAVDTRHPEFAGRIAGQWDAETGAPSSIPNGWQPHGTKVAG